MATIYRRKDTGSYYVSYVLNGKRHRKLVGKSKKVAQIALNDIELKLARNEIGFLEDKKIVNINWEEMFKFLRREYDCKFDIKEYLQKAIKFMEHEK